MRCDGEVIGFIVLVVLGVGVTLAFVFWVLGFPFLNTGFSMVFVSGTASRSGDGWVLDLLVSNKGTREGSIGYVKINDVVCSLNITVLDHGEPRRVFLPGGEIRLGPGEFIRLNVVVPGDVSGCQMVFTSGQSLNICLRTLDGQEACRLVILP